MVALRPTPPGRGFRIHEDWLSVNTEPLAPNYSAPGKSATSAKRLRFCVACEKHMRPAPRLVAGHVQQDRVGTIDGFREVRDGDAR